MKTWPAPCMRNWWNVRWARVFSNTKSPISPVKPPLTPNSQRSTFPAAPAITMSTTGAAVRFTGWDPAPRATWAECEPRTCRIPNAIASSSKPDGARSNPARNCRRWGARVKPRRSGCAWSAAGSLTSFSARRAMNCAANGWARCVNWRTAAGGESSRMGSI